jgi:hypothetical protein
VYRPAYAFLTGKPKPKFAFAFFNAAAAAGEREAWHAPRHRQQMSYR